MSRELGGARKQRSVSSAANLCASSFSVVKVDDIIAESRKKLTDELGVAERSGEREASISSRHGKKQVSFCTKRYLSR